MSNHGKTMGHSINLAAINVGRCNSNDRFKQGLSIFYNWTNHCRIERTLQQHQSDMEIIMKTNLSLSLSHQPKFLECLSGLPLPSANLPPPSSELQLRQPPPEPQKPPKPRKTASFSCDSSSSSSPAPPPPPAAPPKPILKSALKRPKPAESMPEETVPEKKKLMFKTTTDPSEQQVKQAMQKIASHIKTPAKFSKASYVKAETSDYFFLILEAAMASPTACTDPSLQADYHALFSAAQDASECLSKKQKNQLTTWTIRAVMANELFTDDSFLFSKAAGRLREAISNLPVATEDVDREEAAVLEDETNLANEDDLTKQDVTSAAPAENNDEECQTVIDILAKHAFDNVARFTSKQRSAMEKVWDSIREQHNRTKQWKSVTGKLDVNAFEWLRQKCATEKISIRHSVGNSGDRKTEMCLG
ncbi:proteoglycan 4 [Pyrus ussuriensis x Pyrus communis]|uniref:Proteoglycan 4 n=1 Tax=Pyrus ussuriensis x Pyrus communis TaxID=2448454 RepID=A0A5N5H5M6_9ROSA|nr:proteoglycan 4 [Pyrus ussuriensis x Pyrus communis]